MKIAIYRLRYTLITINRRDNGKKILLLVISVFLVNIITTINVGAYSSPYFASRVNDSIPLGFQALQVRAKNGDIYVSSYSDCFIHKITGNSSYAYAGIQGFCGYSPDGSVASQRTLQGPSSIDIGPDGTLYIAESAQHHVRAVSPNGILTTIAGNGMHSSAINGPLTDAPDAKLTMFDNPTYVKVGPDGAIYILDGSIVRRVLPDGSTDHVAGNFEYTSEFVEGGLATAHKTPCFAGTESVNGGSPCSLDFDAEGNLLMKTADGLYIVNRNDNTIHTVYSYNSSQTDSLEDTPLASSSLRTNILTVDNNGEIWTFGGTSSTGIAIRHFSLNEGVVKTAAGGGNTDYPPVAGSGIAPIDGANLKLSSVRSISVDNDHIYFISKSVDSYGLERYYIGRLSSSQDTTPPTISAIISPTPRETGWYNSPIDLSWNITDNESPIASSNGCEPVTITVTTTELCTATSGGGTSSQSATVRIDTARPLLIQPNWNQNPKPTTGLATLSVTAQDDASGIQKAEYFIGNDPGEGNGAAMSIASSSNGGKNVTLSAVFGTDFTTGVYKISVRTQDNAGNWSQVVVDYLVVYDPTGPSMTGRGNVVPILSSSDSLPGLIDSNQADPVKYGLSIKYGTNGQISSRSDLQVSYQTGTNCGKVTAVNCHSLSLNADSMSWFFTEGQNNSTGVFQGMGSLIVDGQTSSVIFRVKGIDGSRTVQASDQIGIDIYSASANPNYDSPIYTIHLKNISKGSIKIT